MSVKNITNMAHSVRDRLLTLAKANGRDVRSAWETGFMGRLEGAEPVDVAFARQIDFTHAAIRETMQRLFREDWIEMRGDVGDLDRQYEYLSAGRMRGANVLLAGECP